MRSMLTINGRASAIGLRVGLLALMTQITLVVSREKGNRSLDRAEKKLRSGAAWDARRVPCLPLGPGGELTCVRAGHLPVAIGIGPAKSGSTALYNALERHPNVSGGQKMFANETGNTAGHNLH